MKMRFLCLLLAVVTAGVSWSTSAAAEPLPTPGDQARAVEAGRQAGPQQSNIVAPAKAGPAPQMSSNAARPTSKAATANAPAAKVTAAADSPAARYRVYTTQYKPLVDGSVEVAVPDKCAKFASLGNADALRSHSCPASYRPGQDYRVTVALDNGRSATFPVKEVGPWNQDDNYWDPANDPHRPRRRFGDLSRGTPEAQAAFYTSYNPVANCKNLDGTGSGRTAGADQFNRCVLNPAGLDLSFEAAKQLGLAAGENAWVTASFLWAPEIPSGPPPGTVPDLYFVKTQSVGSGRIELHTASSTSGFEAFGFHAATPLSPGDTHGDFDVADVNADGREDLVYIKRRNTGGRFEVHVMDGARNGTAFLSHAATPIGTGDDANGQTYMADMNGDRRADLVFVKTKNVGSGGIELHWVNAASGFTTFGGHVVTAFSPLDANNGTFQPMDMNADRVPDLVFVKSRNTAGRIEVHWLTNNSGYRTFGGNRASALGAVEADRGRFVVVDMNTDRRGDLVYIKDTNVGTGRIELFWLDATTGFTQFNLSRATAFSSTEKGRGVFTMGDRSSS